MAESKYSIKMAVIDAYSATFGDFGKKSARVQESIKAQQADLRKLNAQAKDMDGFVKLTENVKKTEAALQAARAEQSRLSREQAQASNRAAELATAYGKAVVATKALESSTEASTVDIAYARAEQKRLGKELDVVTAAAKKLDSQQDKTTAGVKSMERAARRERDELSRLDTSLKSAGVDTSKLAGEQSRLKAAAESVNAALVSQRAKLEAVGRAQGKIDANRAKRGELRGQFAETAAVGYLASRPINHAMNLETAMADVGKVIDFTGNQRAEMAAANLTLASDRLIASSGMTAIDLAKIEYAAGQSGIGKEEKTSEGKQARVMEFTRDAAIMGSAFDINSSTAGETMAGWQASMRLDRKKTLDLADSVNYLGNNFNAKAADIAAVVKRFGAVGSASGLTPEQTAALSAALLNPGTEKEIAGTGFKNFTSALVAGKSATKKEKEQWKELGFDPEDLASEMQKNAPATIMSVLKAINDQPREEQAAIATNLFGSESIGAIQPLLENLKPLEDAFAMVGDKSKYATSVLEPLGKMGSMMQEAAGVANTSRTGLNAFTARLTRLSTVVGNAMLPALNAVLVPLGAMVDGLSWAAETFPGITGALAVAAAGLASLKIGALGLKFVGLLFGQAFNKAGLARAKLDTTTARTTMAADAAVRRLNRTMGGLGGGLDLDGKGRKGRRVRGGAKGKAGAALGALESVAEVAPKVGMLSRAAGVAKVAGRVATPLIALSGAIEAVNGLSEGDSKKVGSGVGGAGGALAGAYAGGATGAAIGTMIFPGVGTAVGGAIGSAVGGFAGSEAGSWLGEKLGALVDRLSSPEKVSKDVAAAATSADNRTFAPVIQISGQDQASAKALADLVLQQIHAQFMPMMMANPLAVRTGASLTDGSK
ncbi:phage tail tape measure protein [Pseudomonas sp. MWU12-2345]|uniref:phage tail tape measure protein n=1 Tax=Pseudomonas sp. MWU12-2345 TaxID=2928689 RepID=UPI00200C31B6|nr:phage tail tape measure protein [Pseudomonas sp. MWU12-2345]